METLNQTLQEAHGQGLRIAATIGPDRDGCPRIKATTFLTITNKTPLLEGHSSGRLERPWGGGGREMPEWLESVCLVVGGGVCGSLVTLWAKWGYREAALRLAVRREAIQRWREGTAALCIPQLALPAIAAVAFTACGTGDTGRAGAAPRSGSSGFEGSPFCQTYSCRADGEWVLRTGGVNRAYRIRGDETILIELASRGGTLLAASGYHIMDRSLSFALRSFLGAIRASHRDVLS